MVVLERAAGARAPRARPRHHAGGRPGGDGALQQRRERARRLGRAVRPLRAAPRARPSTRDAVFEALFREALEGEADAGGLLAYNHLAGEPIAGLDEGRPLFVRTPDSRLTLANFMRAQLYGVFGTLSPRHAGARRRRRRARPHVRARRHVPHRRRRAALPRGRARRTRRGRRDRVRGRCVGHRGARVVPRARRPRPTWAATCDDRVFAGSRDRTSSSPTPTMSPASPPTSTATAPASPSSAPPSKPSDPRTSRRNRT